jgi:hypothetical protein
MQFFVDILLCRQGQKMNCSPKELELISERNPSGAIVFLKNAINEFNHAKM